MMTATVTRTLLSTALAAMALTTGPTQSVSTTFSVTPTLAAYYTPLPTTTPLELRANALEAALTGASAFPLPAELSRIRPALTSTPTAAGTPGLNNLPRVETNHAITAPTAQRIRDLVDRAVHGIPRTQKALALARQVVDSRMIYSWGGGDLNGPTLGISGPGLGAGDNQVVGMDCSAFARYVVFHAFGIVLPRTSGAQWSATVPVTLASARPGDLVFPAGTQGVDHVQIYLGNGMIAEQYQSGTPARITALTPGDEIRRPTAISN